MYYPFLIHKNPFLFGSGWSCPVGPTKQMDIEKRGSLLGREFIDFSKTREEKWVWSTGDNSSTTYQVLHVYVWNPWHGPGSAWPTPINLELFLPKSSNLLHFQPVSGVTSPGSRRRNDLMIQLTHPVLATSRNKPMFGSETVYIWQQSGGCNEIWSDMIWLIQLSS